MRIGAIRALECIAVIALSVQVVEPNLDFEDGLRGWTQSGSAFVEQPTVAAILATTDAAAPIGLGGDYWRGLAYPIGASGAHLIRTSDSTRGTLTSDDIELKPDQRIFSLLIGGANDSLHERVELQVRAQNEGSVTYEREGDYLIVKRFTGAGAERLHEDSAEIPFELRGRPARVKIIDDSAGPGGHINVDDLRFTAELPRRQHAPLWGVGDFHTHVMNHMGFGALHGVRTVWGVPGGRYADYVGNPSLVSRDIPACRTSHDGGPSAEVFINSVEGRFTPTGHAIPDLIRLLRAQHHGKRGGRTFEDFPSFLAGLHQQMHITQIHRAWEGGLRLMVAIAVHNLGVEYLFAKPHSGEVNPSTERQVLDAQICGVKAMAELNSDWMEIAFSPADARRIIERNKLAVVLAVEMDQMGRLDSSRTCTTFTPCPFKTFENEIDYLWNVGIRQITPIHAVDNRLGSAAVFQPVYNSLNDLLNRGKFNLSSKELRYWPARFFEVREGGCARGPYAGQIGECVTFRFDQKQQRPSLMDAPSTLWRTAPFLEDAQVPTYYGFDGMMNAHGLTVEGRDYIGRLMRRGFIVGMEHMSQQSVDDLYGVVADLLRERGHPECADFGRSDVAPVCYQEAYPLLATHGSFRALSVYGRDSTTVEGYRPSEYEFSDREAALIGRTGGFLGQFTAEGPVIPPRDFPEYGAVPNDCAGSSKSFAISYMYGLKSLPAAVGLATDFTIIPGTSPRFGDHKCWASHSAVNPKAERAKMPSQYRLRDQKDGVNYDYYADADRVPDDVSYKHHPPLKAYVMDRRGAPFDFNIDGFAHYGMLPDFLQDLRNVGLSHDALGSLFSSAEAYVHTWEKIGGAMGVTYPDHFKPIWPACEAACHGLCPDSFKAGAP